MRRGANLDTWRDTAHPKSKADSLDTEKCRSQMRERRKGKGEAKQSTRPSFAINAKRVGLADSFLGNNPFAMKTNRFRLTWQAGSWTRSPISRISDRETILIRRNLPPLAGSTAEALRPTRFLKRALLLASQADAGPAFHTPTRRR